MAESAILTKRSRTAEPASPSAILIIDDNPEIRESLQTLLDIEGYHSDGADTAENGLALLSNSVYDLVLLDIGEFRVRPRAA
jgi:DNA-binding NtrC family response regulator